MSNGTNWTRLVETQLLNSSCQLAVSELMHLTRTEDRRVITNAIIRVREKYGHRLMRTTKRVGGEIVSAYRILPTDEHKQRHIESDDGKAFGVDLWRGWFNPLTGIRGARLGLG